jgi:hypothetical protein
VGTDNAVRRHGTPTKTLTSKPERRSARPAGIIPGVSAGCRPRKGVGPRAHHRPRCSGAEQSSRRAWER